MWLSGLMLSLFMLTTTISKSEGRRHFTLFIPRITISNCRNDVFLILHKRKLKNINLTSDAPCFLPKNQAGRGELEVSSGCVTCYSLLIENILKLLESVKTSSFVTVVLERILVLVMWTSRIKISLVSRF